MHSLNLIGFPADLPRTQLTDRQKRMQEIREFQHKGVFGSVEPLSKPDFVKEVTEASATTWVFVHLFKD